MIWDKFKKSAKLQGFNLLVYTYANQKYYDFAILYPIWVLLSNPDTCVEIALENLNLFNKKYSHLIKYYYDNYPNQVYFTQIDKKYLKVSSGAIRFLSQPICKARYVYIGDVDLIVLDNICSLHLPNIEKYKLDYSNIKRKGLEKLSGLHFIEYKKMYPIIFKNINVVKDNDENILYKLMLNKNYKIPSTEDCTYRPLCGIHISYFSRPLLKTLTTKDTETSFPSWCDNCNGEKISVDDIKQYLKYRYSNNIQDFYSQIKETDVELRKIIQIIDLFVYYLDLNNELLINSKRREL